MTFCVCWLTEMQSLVPRMCSSEQLTLFSRCMRGLNLNAFKNHLPALPSSQTVPLLINV